MNIVFVTDRKLDRVTGETAHVIQIVNALSEECSGKLTVIAPRRNSAFSLSVSQVPFQKGHSNGSVKDAFAYCSLLARLRDVVGRQPVDVVYMRLSIPLTPLLPIIRLLARNQTLLLEVNGLAVEELQALRRAPLVRPILRLIEAPLLNLANATIVVAEPIMDALSKRGVRAIHVVENGADEDRFRPLLRNPRIQFELGLESEDPVVGFVGNVTAWQGLEVLLDAARQILESKPKTKFLIVGSGDHLQRIEEYAKSLGLEDSVIFVGAVDHEVVPSYISLFTCAVTPTVELAGAGAARSSLKTYEYLACAKPVVVSAFPGIADEVQEQDLGKVVEPGNPDCLADAIIQLLEMPSGQLEEMGRRGRDLVVREHSWKHTARRIIDIINGWAASGLMRKGSLM